MMQLKPFDAPFIRRMFDRKTEQAVFYEEAGILVEEPEDLSGDEGIMHPKATREEPKVIREEARKHVLSDNEDDDLYDAMTSRMQSPSIRPEVTSPKPSEPINVTSISETVKVIQFEIPETTESDVPERDASASPLAKKRSPPIRRPSSTVSSGINSPPPIDIPQSNLPSISRRILSFPRTLEPSPMESKATAQAEKPTVPRRDSTMSPPPPSGPKPNIPPLKRRATIPAESQASRQLMAVQSAKCITLPSVDIIQNAQLFRESELLVDLLNILKNYWPDRPYAVMNHLRNSLIIAIAACDDPKPQFASDYGGGVNIKQVACRFRRHRVDKPPIDLSLVLWNESFMSFREQCVLQETHRYRPQQAGESSLWPAAQRVVWYPSWEPSTNLPAGFPDSFSREKEGNWTSGGEDLKFEVQVSDGDWC